MSHTVAVAGVGFALNDFPATQTQLSTTNATAMLVIHLSAPANQATMDSYVWVTDLQLSN